MYGASGDFEELLNSRGVSQLARSSAGAQANGAGECACVCVRGGGVGGWASAEGRRKGGRDGATQGVRRPSTPRVFVCCVCVCMEPGGWCRDSACRACDEPRSDAPLTLTHCLWFSFGRCGGESGVDGQAQCSDAGDASKPSAPLPHESALISRLLRGPKARTGGKDARMTTTATSTSGGGANGSITVTVTVPQGSAGVCVAGRRAMCFLVLLPACLLGCPTSALGAVGGGGGWMGR
jgi:hypothetical protein